MHHFFVFCRVQVVVGRGRGRGARGGRMVSQNRQSSRVAESQPSTVSIDGLSSSTTEKQIKNLLNSIGPIQVHRMLYCILIGQKEADLSTLTIRMM